MLFFYIKRVKRGNNDVKVQLVYKSSPEANFRLSKALNMLISEEDIRNYFKKSFKKSRASLRNTRFKPGEKTGTNFNLHFLIMSPR